jgi:hypothetical protein
MKTKVFPRSPQDHPNSERADTDFGRRDGALIGSYRFNIKLYPYCHMTGNFKSIRNGKISKDKERDPIKLWPMLNEWWEMLLARGSQVPDWEVLREGVDYKCGSWGQVPWVKYVAEDVLWREFSTYCGVFTDNTGELAGHLRKLAPDKIVGGTRLRVYADENPIKFYTRKFVAFKQPM